MIAVSKAYADKMNIQSFIKEEAAKLQHEKNVKTLSVCEKVLKDLMVDSRLNAHRRILGELRFESLIASAVKDYIESRSLSPTHRKASPTREAFFRGEIWIIPDFYLSLHQ